MRLRTLVLVAVSALLQISQVAAQPAADDDPNDKLSQKAVLGPVTATVEVSPKAPLIGDVISVTIEVVSEPLVEVLMPEFGEALDQYRVLDFAPQEKILDNGKSLSKQTYRLQPPISGKKSIPPILIEFVDNRPGQTPSPEDYDAYELLTPRLDFVVDSVIPDDATADLKPPLGELQIEQPRLISKRRVRWLIGIAIVLAGAIWRWLRKPTDATRIQSAYEIARQRLDLLLTQPIPTDTEQVEAFYVELSDIVRRYLEDRFRLRAPELTTEEFLEKVSESPDLQRDHQQLLREFLRQADLVKFAGMSPDEQTIRKSIDAANRFIDETKLQADVQAESDMADSRTGAADG